MPTAGLSYCIIIGILIELRQTFIVLNRDRAAEIVELHDLLISIMVSEGILVMCVADAQCSASSTSIVFSDPNHTVRLTAAGGVIGVGKLIPIRIAYLRQKMVTGIGKAC